MPTAAVAIERAMMMAKVRPSFDLIVKRIRVESCSGFA
jgi:hypothetical protein